MQIREIALNELQDVYDLVKSHYTYSLDEFENIIYDMRHQNYKMYGIFEKNRVVSFAGISVLSSLEFQQHLHIYELITDSEYILRGYDRELILYLNNHAKVLQCKHVILGSSKTFKNLDEFFKMKEFRELDEIYIKEL
ncbi:MAG: hypothetical protein GQ570_08725 [Helicobacteraceae bacterium]|nr:hypothetical protein [Helicobacteraceae bacterium]